MCIRPHPLPRRPKRPVETGPRSPGTCPRPAAAASDVSRRSASLMNGDEPLKPYSYGHLAVCQNLVPLVNIKIAGKWMFIPLKWY